MRSIALMGLLLLSGTPLLAATVSVSTTNLTGYSISITSIVYGSGGTSFTTLSASNENQIYLTATISPLRLHAVNASSISWVVDDDPLVPGDSGTPAAPANGALTTLTITAPPAAAGRGFPLNFRIRAYSQIEGGIAVDTTTIIQDVIDQARQEYIDMNKNTKPPRSSFSNSGQSSGGNFTFAELNSGDFTYAIVTDALYSGLEAIRSGLGNVPLTITSGYRNPRHNAAVGGATESQHIYGTAADIAIIDTDGDGVADETDWQTMANVACDDAGATFVERYSQSSTHVHADWGPSRGDADTNYCIGRVP